MKPGMSFFDSSLPVCLSNRSQASDCGTFCLKAPNSAFTIFDAIKISDTMHGEAKSYCSDIDCVPESIFNYLLVVSQ